MSKKEEDIVKKYGIRVEVKKHYFYKNYRYERLEDAIAFSIQDSKNRGKWNESL